MNKQGIFVGANTIFLANSASAGTMGAVYDGYQKVITVSGGVAWDLD